MATLQGIKEKRYDFFLTENFRSFYSVLSYWTVSKTGCSSDRQLIIEIIQNALNVRACVKYTAYVAIYCLNGNGCIKALEVQHKIFHLGSEPL